MAKPIIILFDLETLPDLDKALEVWTQLGSWPGRTMKATITSIICAGYKEFGSKKSKCINAWDFPNWEKNVNDDKEVCKAIYEVLKRADAVVTWNGKKFDWKFLQTRLMVNGLDPLHDIVHIDALLVARKNLFAFSNRLGDIGKLLVNDDKLDNGGWKLWVKVHKRQKAAMKLMTEYCKQDVTLLEKCFVKLMPFIKNLPNRNLFRNEKQRNENIRLCPYCGSENTYFNGWRYSKTVAYQRLHCQDCGSHSRLDVRGNNPRSV